MPLLNRLSVMDPEEVAPIAIAGLLKKKAVIIPGLLNRWFILMDRLLPEFLKKMIIKNTSNKIDPNSRYNNYYEAKATVFQAQ